MGNIKGRMVRIEKGAMAAEAAELAAHGVPTVVCTTGQNGELVLPPEWAEKLAGPPGTWPAVQFVSGCDPMALV